MEVGLMLNASSEDGEHPRPLLTWETTIRSRTPWDAGGYSLPVNHNLDAAITKHIHHNDSSIESSQIYPTKHSLSDSQGSLSSFASASTSTHSRFSSASTVGGFQAFSNLTDTAKLSDSTVDWTSILTNSATLSPVSPATFNFHQYPPSPCTEPINSLTQVGERRHMEADGPPRERRKDNDMAGGNMRESSVSSGEQAMSRTASPTDALLIKRHTSSMHKEVDSRDGTVSTQPLLVGEENIQPRSHQSRAHLDGMGPFPLLDNCREFESHSGRFSTETRRHKRAFSEPQIQGQTRASFGQATGEIIGKYQRSEPTPPSSLHPENESPRAEMLEVGQHITPQYTPPLQDLQSTCMFKEGCDTGSQPRKAVSHIFGRNKMCTRLIPEHVWVRYCRKHYQRSRYREPKNWPRCQCDLVQKQILRLEEWSAENERRGEGGVVRSWGLAVRKREQKRLDDLALSKARGSRGSINGTGNDEDTDPSAPATAVPRWLRHLCGKTYSTPDIKDIFNRVHQELLNSPSPIFPDIEILPHITLDGDELESPMRYGRRKTPTTHQRSRSMGGSVPQLLDSFPEDLAFKSPSGSTATSYFEHQGSPLQNKRKRRDCSPEDVDAELTAQSQRLRLNVTPGEYGHDSQPSILSASSRASEALHAQGLADHYRSPLTTPGGSIAPLQSLPGILGNVEIMSNRYPLSSGMMLSPESMHRRSRSDINALQDSEAAQIFRARSHSSAYQFQENTPQGSPVNSRYPSVFPLRGGERMTPPRRSSSGHYRHQSTPVAPRPSLTPPSRMPPLPPLSRSQFSGAYEDGIIVLPKLSIDKLDETRR